MGEHVRLLDATLRDGSYCVDFQFTAADCAFIVSTLDQAGVGFIELGHGSGTFNHKAPPEFRSKTRQAATDEGYLAAARGAATRAKLGVITGAFAIGELGLLVDHGFDFVRLAIMADRALNPPNLAIVDKAKSLGLICSVNLMQTVALTPGQLAEASVAFEKAGADWLYIVDSAGGMMPSSVSEYVRAVRDASGLTVGLHAHHNAGLALANCIAAIEAGATMVDGTLQGLGREVGNAPTEQLLLLLQRLGHERDIRIDRICVLGDLTRRMMERGNDPTFFASGTAEVHSANIAGLSRLADERGVSLRALLAAISMGGKRIIGAGLSSFPEDVIGPACELVQRARDPEPSDAVVSVVAKEIEDSSSARLPALAAALFARAAKQHATSVLHLVPADQFSFSRPLPWELGDVCGVSVPWVDSMTADDLADRKPDVLVVDRRLAALPVVEMPCVLVDDFTDTLAEAAAATALAAIEADAATAVWMVGADERLGNLIDHRLLALGIDRAKIHLAPPAIAGWVSRVSARDTIILLGRADSHQSEQLRSASKRVLRAAIGPVIAARVASALAVRRQLAATGPDQLVGPVNVPAAGEIVVDDPECPRAVLEGTADTLPRLARAAARQRLRALLRARGRL